MTVFSDEESDLLDRIAIDIELERLSPINEALIQLRTPYRPPADYAGPWPPRKDAIGEYVGLKYLGRPISATRVQERIRRILDRWRRLHQLTGPQPVLSLTPTAPHVTIHRPAQPSHRRAA